MMGYIAITISPILRTGAAYSAGKKATEILAKKGIDVNSPLNGVYLPGCGYTGTGGAVGLAIHCGKHTKAYEEYVLKELEAVGGMNASKIDIINTLTRIRRELTDGELVLNARGNI